MNKRVEQKMRLYIYYALKNQGYSNYDIAEVFT